MSDRARLPQELRWIVENKLNGVPHAEDLLRAATALEEGSDVPAMCDMPLFIDIDDRRRDSFLRVPWPMTKDEFEHIKKALIGLDTLYGPHFDEPTP